MSVLSKPRCRLLGTEVLGAPALLLSQIAARTPRRTRLNGAAALKAARSPPGSLRCGRAGELLAGAFVSLAEARVRSLGAESVPLARRNAEEAAAPSLKPCWNHRRSEPAWSSGRAVLPVAQECEGRVGLGRQTSPCPKSHFRWAPAAALGSVMFFPLDGAKARVS